MVRVSRPDIKWIAARVQTGTAKGAKSVLPHLAQSQDQRKTAKALEPCAQPESKSMVFTGVEKGFEGPVTAWTAEDADGVRKMIARRAGRRG